MLQLKELIDGGEAELQRLVDSRQQEDLTLDFKADNSREPLFKGNGTTKQGRFVFAKAISAFANSAGGLIVVGIDCRPNQDGVDCAKCLTPIPDYEAVYSRLSQEVSSIVQPAVSEITVHQIPSETQEGSGYLLISVPRSERRPHRCEVKEKQYFKRSGSSSITMEHYEIEDAFRRLGTPDLRIESTLQFGGSIGGPEGRKCTAVLKIVAKNEGFASAKHVSFRFKKDTGFSYRLGLSKHNQLQHDVVKNWVFTHALPEIVVHPGQTAIVYNLNFDVVPGNPRFLIEGQQESQPQYGIPYTIFAENMHPRDGILTFTYQELLEEVIR